MTDTRRRIVGTVILLLLLLVGAVAVARVRLATVAIRSALQAEGASDLRFVVTRVSPWRLAVANLGFTLAARSYDAGAIEVTRAHWWSRRFQAVRVSEAVVAIQPPAGAKQDTKTEMPAADAAVPQVDLPFEELSIDGRLVIDGGANGESLQVDVRARRGADDAWTGSVRLAGPGIAAEGDVAYQGAPKELSVDLKKLQVDVARARPLLQPFVPLLDPAWVVEGTLVGDAHLRWAGEGWSGSGTVQMDGVSLRNDALRLAGDGGSIRVHLSDLFVPRTEMGQVRMRELRVGAVRLDDVQVDAAMEGTDRIRVQRLSARTFGGSVATEAFDFRPSVAAVDAVVNAEALQAQEIMALTKDVPAQVTGSLSGRLPLHLDANGVRFGTGWLGIHPGTQAEVQLQAAGLLTGGTSPKSPSYSVLQRIENGLLRLQVNELRLEIRPPDSPAGRSARLHVAGQPADPSVKAPVTLDLNVNGPIESLLNLSLKTGAGTKP